MSSTPATLADTLAIRGGKPLRGEVAIRGAKNALPKIMVATLLTDEPCVLRNVSGVADVEIVSDLIRALGGEVTAEPGELHINNANLRPMQRSILKEFSGKSRIPILTVGPLLARLGEAPIPSLGGCRIGPRPVDFHIRALQELGGELYEEPGASRLTAAGLKGTKIHLDYPSVGATEQVVLTAVRAEGVTELSNAAVEPEIIDLSCVLQ
jgi:UDP-N-acetylglucosamine 1-carboxyvinyltransferase